MDSHGRTLSGELRLGARGFNSSRGSRGPLRGPPRGGLLHGGPIRGGPHHGGPPNVGLPRGGPPHGGLLRGGLPHGGPPRSGPHHGGPPRGGPPHQHHGGPPLGGPPHGGLRRGGPPHGVPPRGGPLHRGPLRGGTPRCGPLHGGLPPGGPPRGGPPPGGPPQGGPPYGGYKRLERPQYDDYGYNDGYQGGYGRGPQGGQMRPPPLPIQLENQSQHTYTALGPKQRGFKRPAHPPAMIGPPQPKRFTPVFPSVPPEAPVSGPPPPKRKQSMIMFNGPETMTAAATNRIHTCLRYLFRGMKVHLYANGRRPPNSAWQIDRVRRIIRDRVYNMLMHKTVGNNTELVAMYRERYPQSDDAAFVQSVKESMEEDCFAQYMGKNLAPALTKTLEDMFTKISKLSDEETGTIASEVSRDVEMSEAPATVMMKSEISEPSTEPEATMSGKNAEAIKQEISEFSDMKNHDEETYKIMLEQMIKHSLPKVLPLFKHAMVQIMCKGGRFTYTDEEVKVSEIKNGEGNHENGSNDANKNQETTDAASESEIRNDAGEMEELLTLIKDTTEGEDKADEVTEEEEKIEEEGGRRNGRDSGEGTEKGQRYSFEGNKNTITCEYEALKPFAEELG